MSGNTPVDPAAFFREMLGQWESMANEFGGNMMKSGEFTRVMHGANAAALKAREVSSEMMDRALSAANMPSKGDVADLSARLHRVEESMMRVEAMLRAALMAQGVGEIAAEPSAARPKPKRTRKPPSQVAGKDPGKAAG
ncbi:MAG: hypothetical protein K2P68_11800 [Sphingomonas sp.]|nr:hypothetical protein [Sphingomonas sp.]